MTERSERFQKVLDIGTSTSSCFWTCAASPVWRAPVRASLR